MKIGFGAGHGGGDPGAVSQGFKEADLARQVVAEIMKQSVNYDFEAIDITDNSGSLRNAINKANASGVNLAVQIHWNAGGNKDKTFGFEAWYDNATSLDNIADARECARAFNAYFGFYNRGAKNDSTNRLGNLGWCSDTKMPAQLWEMGFIDSKDVHIIMADLAGAVKTLLDVFGNHAIDIPPIVIPPTAQFEPVFYGTAGPEVKKLQQNLVKAGFSVGAIDGDFGRNTAHALGLFMKKNGIAMADDKVLKLLG